MECDRVYTEWMKEVRRAFGVGDLELAAEPLLVAKRLVECADLNGFGDERCDFELRLRVRGMDIVRDNVNGHARVPRNELEQPVRIGISRAVLCDPKRVLYAELQNSCPHVSHPRASLIEPHNCSDSFHRTNGERGNKGMVL